MAAPAYEALLALQDLDVKLTQLRHRHAHHPLRDEIAATDVEIAEIDATGTEIAGRKQELDGKQAALDAQVTEIEGRRSEIDTKLYDGSVTGTKDLLAMQEEAASLLERQRGIEDDELEIMEQVESVTGELEVTASARGAKVDSKEKLEAELATVLDALERETDETETARTTAAGDVPDGLLGHYENLKDDFGGIAVARLVSGSTCDGCHMALSAVSLDKIKKLADDAVVTCDQCGRLLIR